MSGRTSIVRGSVRAATGLVITGIAATAAIVLGTGDSFQVERPPLALTVDTQQGGEQRLHHEVLLKCRRRLDAKPFDDKARMRDPLDRAPWRQA